MRCYINVERLRHSNGSYLVGPDATRLLSGIEGVSLIRLEKQYIDRAVLSYKCTGEVLSPTKMDQLLASKGLRRVQASERILLTWAPPIPARVEPAVVPIERRPARRPEPHRSRFH